MPFKPQHWVRRHPCFCHGQPNVVDGVLGIEMRLVVRMAEERLGVCEQAPGACCCGIADPEPAAGSMVSGLISDRLVGEAVADPQAAASMSALPLWGFDSTAQQQKRLLDRNSPVQLGQPRGECSTTRMKEIRYPAWTHTVRCTNSFSLSHTHTNLQVTLSLCAHKCPHTHTHSYIM